MGIQVEKSSLALVDALGLPGSAIKHQTLVLVQLTGFWAASGWMLTALQTSRSQCFTPHVAWTSQTRRGGQRGLEPANPRGRNFLSIVLSDLLKGLSQKMSLFYLHTLSRGAVWQDMSIIQGSLHKFCMSFNTLHRKLTMLYLHWGVDTHTWVSTQGRVKIHRVIWNSWGGQRSVQLHSARDRLPDQHYSAFSCWTPVSSVTPKGGSCLCFTSQCYTQTCTKAWFKDCKQQESCSILAKIPQWWTALIVKFVPVIPGYRHCP